MPEPRGQLGPRLDFRALLLQNQPDVLIDHLVRFALRVDVPAYQQNRPVRKLFHQAQIVRNKQHRNLPFAQLFELAYAAVGKHRIAHRQRFVHHQNLRLHVNRRRKRQPHIHAARVFFHRPLQKLADVRECRD